MQYLFKISQYSEFSYLQCHSEFRSEIYTFCRIGKTETLSCDVRCPAHLLSVSYVLSAISWGMESVLFLFLKSFHFITLASNIYPFW